MACSVSVISAPRSAETTSVEANVAAIRCSKDCGYLMSILLQLNLRAPGAETEAEAILAKTARCASLAYAELRNR
jgi:hypothetical protein